MNNFKQAALAEGSYVAFTKGSGRDGAGGCAYRLYSPDGEMTEASRQSTSTTSNIAEMSAVVDALTATPIGAVVFVCLDSGYIKDNFEKYLAGWIKDGWLKSDGTEVRNKEWWEKIAALTETRKVTFHKTKARAGCPDSKHVKTLAKDAMNKAYKRASEEVLRALRKGV
jgi:ribonuclease HI